MRKLLIALLLSVPIVVLAQNQRSSNIFPRYGNYQNKGWIIHPSLTYMMPPVKAVQKQAYMGNDTVYDLLFDTKGKVGVGIEIGRFKAVEASRIISYIDFSAGLKMLRGAESFVGTLRDDHRQTPYTKKGGGVFSHSYFTASFNATHARALSKDFSMHHTLGVNADYRFAQVDEYRTNIFPLKLMEPTDFLFQAHYKIGFGYKLSQNLMMIPSLETPILSFYEYDDLKSSLPILNSRYRPLIFRLTFMVLDNKADRKCPKINKPRKQNETLFGTGKNRPW